VANPSDQKSTDDLRGDAARVLLRLKDDILMAWEKRVRKVVYLAAELSQPVIIDSLPIFIANLAEALAENHGRGTATESNNVAQEHGGERARVTRYGPEQIIQEYQILRDVIEETLRANITPSNREYSVIQKSFDQAIQEAMMAYFLVHGKVRDQFIATLTHDLRNPLAAARLSADLILRKLADSENPFKVDELKRQAQTIINCVKRADRMIQNLLDTNVMEVGELVPLNIGECDMLEIVHSVVAEFSISEKRNAKIVGDNARGFWDSDGIFRALENLTGNAFKYGKEGTPVTIRIYEKLGRVMVSVHNEGNPIPAEEQDLLFQAFRRSATAKNSGKKGWGIGLTQVRGVAEAHGGTLTVDSSLEGGSTFTIDLPRDSRPLKI
jgi:signal transduction histidine kinase